MSRLAIDFAPRSARSLWHQLPLAAIALLLLAVLLLVAGAWQLWSLQQQTTLAQQALADVTARVLPAADRARQAEAPQITAVQAQAVNAAVRKLNVPWEELLDTLEEAASPKVALLELRPDIATQQLVGIAEAGTSDAMFAYVRKLQGQPMLGNVYLSNHQVSEQDRNQPIRFEFTASWREFQP